MSATRRFAVLLGLIVVLGAGLRVAYVLTVTQHDHRLYDATYYELQAETIVNGEGFFTDPFLIFNTPAEYKPAADHPPLTVISLLPAASLSSDHASNLAMRFTMVLFGTGTILILGLLARSIAGPVAGLLAALVAALDPNLWMNDGLIMSEALAVLLITGLLAVCWRVLQRGVTWRRVTALGVLTALAALTRAELAVVLVLLVLPTLFVASGVDRRLRLRSMAGAVAIFVLAISPWCIYNLTRFEKPVFISTGAGLALRSSSCPTTYYGAHIGSSEVFPPCAVPRGDEEQSVWDQENLHAAWHYITGHLTRLPVVVAARLGRIWSVFKISQAADPNHSEGRPGWAVWLGAVATWVLVPLGIAGAFVLRRGRQRIWPLVVTVVGLSLTVVLLAGGLLRYRAPAEPALIVLVSVALASWIGAAADRAIPTT